MNPTRRFPIPWIYIHSDDRRRYKSTSLNNQRKPSLRVRKDNCMKLWGNGQWSATEYLLSETPQSFGAYFSPRFSCIWATLWPQSPPSRRILRDCFIWSPTTPSSLNCHKFAPTCGVESFAMSTTFSAVLPTSLPALSTIFANASGLLVLVRSHIWTGSKILL